MYGTGDRKMQTNKLRLIAQKAKQDKTLRFTTLVHHINAESLAECYKLLKKDKACGIDGITLNAYGANLHANIADLVIRLKTKRYRPKCVRRVYIPKPGKNEYRPLGIPTVEDKLVQMALKQMLEAIYEQDFMECSHGFRKDKSCHTAIKQLDNVVMHKPINYICEIDIRKFFDTVDHEILMQMLKLRIADPNMLWLINQQLKAGVMKDGIKKETNAGTPQGGVISPLLANIYLNYVLDVWFEIEFKRKSKGYVELIRYCDDAIVACESEYDANRFLKELEIRLAEFGLAISKEKTKVVKFGRRAWKQAQQSGKKVETFDFLGFTHYCGKSRQGWFSMRYKTSKQNLARKTTGYARWLKQVRNLCELKEIWKCIKAKLNGHFSYFGISGNFRCLQQYYKNVFWITFKWINRRSQKKSMTFKQFVQYIEWNPLPTPRIKHSMW
jgi:RNA-directed DNA polymerase